MTDTPDHLAPDVRNVWQELRDHYPTAQWPTIIGPAFDAYCGQIARLRDAQHRIHEEGAIIADPKGNPIPHPALAIERAAQDEIRKWSDTFRPRRK